MRVDTNLLLLALLYDNVTIVCAVAIIINHCVSNDTAYIQSLTMSVIDTDECDLLLAYTCMGISSHETHNILKDITLASDSHSYV